MPKIFRLYKEGVSTYEDWNHSPAFPYNSTSRDTIEDPDGASAQTEITSIPSPFARIDLVKTAFKEVCKPGNVNLDGNTIFHKMVSHTLDVAEIFFNLDKYQGQVEVIKWDPALMLNQLATSESAGHRYYADALRKYMLSDGSTYNFNNLQSIYLLNYVGGPSQLNIIGATSPATLFFSTANDLNYVDDIFLGENKPFSDQYYPLYKRDFQFVRYMYVLSQSINGFATLFPEIRAYIIENFKSLDKEKRNQLLPLTSNNLVEFEPIDVKDNQQNNVVEILGFNLYKQKSHDVSTTSDFVISPTIQSNDLPLVLPVDAGNRYRDLFYTTGKWGSSNRADYKDQEKDIAKRKLPFDGATQPYLTISDFLEDTIIKVPHTLNTTDYFDCHIKITKPELSFLIPLKPLFFKYFTIEDLKANMADGKPMMSLELLAGDSVCATLRIPIKGNGSVRYIEYSRIYYNNSSADISINAGNIAEVPFTGFIMPQVRFNNSADALYNVSCVQPANGKIEFEFFEGAQKLYTPQKSCRNEDKETYLRSDNYLIKNNNFDYIQVRSNSYQGLLMPIFKRQRNVSSFEFAIDLGTTNTHIEYRKDGEAPKEFSYSTNDCEICKMFLPKQNEAGNLESLQEESELIEQEYIPDEVGNGDFKFPTRTVLSCSNTIDWTEAVDPFTLVNLPFTFNKRSDDRAYNTFKYNIKWGKGDDLSVMEAYVRTLMVIIRNKVLLNNGDLSKTKITWFYPISMAPKRLRRLKETWDEAYKEYFGDGATVNMTESSAPIQYYFSRYATATSLVNVDIGGGTTDIAFARNKAIEQVTSFRFASNTLFENSFTELDNQNGTVDFYKESILNLLEEKNLWDLVRVYHSPSNLRPANMASFLFGLKDISILQNNGVNGKAIDFNYLLQEDEDFKIIFIVFYTAIIYHIAQITKGLGLDMPRHIAFSGNGSKVIRIITTDNQLLARYTKIIFEKVLGKPYDKELELIGLDKNTNPKTSTCKGGLLHSGDERIENETIVFKSDNTGIVTSEDTYASIDSDYKARTIEAVKDFFKFVFEDMNNAFNFDNNFGVKKASFKIAQEVARKDLLTFLEKGIEQRREESEAEDKIEETFFFYPIKGVLQNISLEIFNSLKRNNDGEK